MTYQYYTYYHIYHMLYSYEIFSSLLYIVFKYFLSLNVMFLLTFSLIVFS